MNQGTRSRGYVYAACVTACFGLALIFFQFSSPPLENPQPRRALAPAAAAAPKPATPTTPPSLATPPAAPVPITAPPEETPEFIADQNKLHDILIIEEPNSAKVGRLLAVMPHLAKESQVYCAQHICNLADDRDYAQVRRAMFQKGLAPEAAEVIYSDCLNRPIDVLLPTLLEVARTPNHPLKQEAYNTLAFMTEADHGENWPAWSNEIARRLAEAKEAR
jgi:hypothetical protein